MAAAPRNLKSALKDAGVEVGARDVLTVAPEHVTAVEDEEHFLFDPSVHDPIDPLFLEDVKENGVIEPVVIWRDGSDEEGIPRLLIVEGRKRQRHLLEANRLLALDGKPEHRLPCVTVPGRTDPQKLFQIMLAANHDPTRSVRSRAFVVARARERGLSWEEIRQNTGHSVPTLQALEAFLQIHEDVAQKIDEKRLPIGSIADFLEVPRDKQQEMLAEVMAEAGEGSNGKRRKVTTALTRKAAARRTGNAPPAGGVRMLPRPKIAELVQRLGPDTKAGALLRFVLGEQDALDGHPTLKAKALGEDVAEAEGQEATP